MTRQETIPPRPKEDDLLPQSFPQDLNWSDIESYKSLQSVYNFVNTECERAISWYYDRKNIKKFLGYTFRLGAILTGAIAGIIPILGEIFDNYGISYLSPAWATVSLAIATLFVALDRLGGYTSGWVRYVRTAQKLTTLQGNFQLDWEEFRLSKNEHNIDFAIAQDGIQLCKEFLDAVNSEVQNETNIWAQEFQQALVEIEKQSKDKLPRSRQPRKT